jgi:hypothetical protein
MGAESFDLGLDLAKHVLDIVGSDDGVTESSQDDTLCDTSSNQKPILAGTFGRGKT